MKVSREQMMENRARILDAASALFRHRGFEVVTVAEVMKAAGMTHGGFYGHFASKDDLIAHAVAHSLAPSESDPSDIGTWLDAYLSPYHRNRPATGCPSAGLAGLLAHQSREARLAMTEGLYRQIDRMAEVMPVSKGMDPRTAGIGSWAAMVGAIILARATDDVTLSNEILDRTRAWIDVSADIATEK